MQARAAFAIIESFSYQRPLNNAHVINEHDTAQCTLHHQFTPK